MKNNGVCRAFFFVITICFVLTGSASTRGADRVSVDPSGAQVNNASTAPAISLDGRYVAFQSIDNNLVAGDTNGVIDIFVHDRETGETIRVSVDSNGVQANGNSREPDISQDGRRIVFESDASNLVDGDTNGVTDIFMHDCDTGETVRVSVSSDNSQANGNSLYAAISGDGQSAAFESNASNLVSGDTNGNWDIFAYNFPVLPDDSGTDVDNDADGGTGGGGGGCFVNSIVSAGGLAITL